MNRVAAMVLVVLLLGLAACGGGSDSASGATTPGGNVAFLAAIHAQNIPGDESALIDVAHAMCDMVHTSDDVGTFASLGLARGVAAEDLSAIILAAVNAYCPEDRDAVDGYTASH